MKALAGGVQLRLSQFSDNRSASQTLATETSSSGHQPRKVLARWDTILSRPTEHPSGCNRG
jgi:hypothetical protein